MKCRHCKNKLELSFIDLGSAPPSNAYLTATSLKEPEKWYPLKVLVCSYCWLVQTEDYRGADDLFDSNYAYFSSYSKTWLQHAELYVKSMVERFNLNATSTIVEVAANDGYLLQYVMACGIPCYGIEPTASTAAAARKKGLDIIEEFFDIHLAKKLVAQGKSADLMIANNVLAHVPNINTFVQGFARLLKPQGVATFEFPHLLRLIFNNQFDTIYHEHFSYLSFTAVEKIFNANDLCIFDVEELPTHGGSLRVFAQRIDYGKYPTTERIFELKKQEQNTGITNVDFYKSFQVKADKVKNDLVTFLIEKKNKNKKIIAYGAAAKGNTLLNYAGVRNDLLSWVVDRNPAKQGKFMPGSRIPICSEDRIRSEKPDYILILPWNLRSEIREQLSYIRDWGGQFITAVPKLRVGDTG